MRQKTILYVLLSLLLAGCSTTKWTLRGKEGQAPITPHRLSELRAIESIAISEPRGITSWDEEGHTYVIDLGFITRRQLFHKIPTLSGKETLRYKGGAWARYLNERLSRIGIRIEGIVLSVPNHLIIFRGYEAPSRKRVVECLMHPGSYSGRDMVWFSEPDIYTSENMAVRELYEAPADDQILIVDHLRDRNGVGDLCIAYIMQDTSRFSEREKKRYSFLGDMEYRNLFGSRSLTYQHIEMVISPITVSLLPTCRYMEFVPRDSSELIPRAFLVE